MRHLAIAILLLAACGDDVKTVAELQDPTTCLDCHKKHHDQWSGSMHAYASDDPVFVAMNKRGQRETNGELGTFCVQCHAPMAVANKTVTAANAGAFDPTTLAPAERGITCYFCHNVEKVNADHNNGLQLAMDQTMRGGTKHPVDSPAHHTTYDALMDGRTNNSEMCGSCHDVVTPKGVALESTFQEWKTTFFSLPDPRHHLACGSSCHMGASTDVIADKSGLNVPSRPDGFHEHLWPGIDEALIPFANPDAMSAGIERDLHNAITITGPTPRGGGPAPGGICLDPGPMGLSVRIDSINVGHGWPSGVGHDRRAWLEVIAYRADNTIAFSSGVVPADKDPEEINDPNLVGFWDRTFKEDGTPAHFFWDVATIKPFVLKGPTTLDQNDPAFDHSYTARFSVPDLTAIDHITARVRIRALPFRVLDLLVASGDLDAAVASRIKTLEISGTVRHWDKATKGMVGSPAVNTNCSPTGKY